MRDLMKQIKRKKKSEPKTKQFQPDLSISNHFNPYYQFFKERKSANPFKDIELIKKK